MGQGFGTYLGPPRLLGLPAFCLDPPSCLRRSMTLDHVIRQIKARVVLMDGLIDKADWVAVIETAEELIALERQRYVISQSKDD